MELLADIGQFLVLAATEGEEEGGSFLVSPGAGLMIWTLVVFLFTMWVLSKLAFPRIQEALDKRARAISESIEAAEKTRSEADELLAEYRARLKEAREQAEEIVSRAREEADGERQRALEDARQEVANLTIDLAEKVVGQNLDRERQLGLVEQYISRLERRDTR